MSYKDYIWPCNPETVTVSRAKSIGKYPIPHAGNTLQDLGKGSRTVSGSGAFAGAGCAQKFQKLAAVFSEQGAGQLILPGMAPFSAIFFSLTQKGDPRPNRIAYEFEFWEDGSAPEKESLVSNPEIYCCKAGDTLFSIAASYGIGVDVLLAANPGIQWPNDPGDGTEVTVP
jgi:LysM repeat protein